MGTEDDLCIGDFTSSLISRLPLDVLVKIISFLPVGDVCVMGRCSRFWRDLCRSDSVWSALFRLRWPSLFNPPISDLQRKFPPPPWNPNSVEDWKLFYCKRQSEMFSLAGVDKSRYARSETLAANHYGFIDVEQFSFCEGAGLQIILTGLFYAIVYLQVPRKLVAQALRRRNIHKKEAFPEDRNTVILHRALVPAGYHSGTLTLEDVTLCRYGVYTYE